MTSFLGPAGGSTFCTASHGICWAVAFKHGFCNSVVVGALLFFKISKDSATQGARGKGQVQGQGARAVLISKNY